MFSKKEIVTIGKNIAYIMIKITNEPMLSHLDIYYITSSLGEALNEKISSTPNISMLQ